MSSSTIKNYNIPLDEIRYNEQGLVPAIAQDYLDGTGFNAGVDEQRFTAKNH